VPSWTRANVGCGGGNQLSEDGIGHPPLEAAHRFHPGLAGGELAAIVGAAFGVEPIWVVAAM
jgi:hypothetical protein